MTQAVPSLLANGLEIKYVTIVDGSGAAIANVASLGQKAMAASSPVVVASDQSAIKTRGGATAATLTNVASSATSVAILALNTARIGATVVNDSTAVLYLKFGGTASATSYSVQLAAGDYFEVPYGYSGQIDGIWASANGNARVTELS